MFGNGPRLPRAKAAMIVLVCAMVAGCNFSTPRPVESALALYPDVDFPFENPPLPQRRPADVPPPPPRVAVPPAEDEDGEPEAEVESLPSGFAELVGSGEPDVVATLGEPNWFEDIPPARMWQYASANCVLQLYFFMELSTRNFRVLSYELESDYDGDDVERQCFGEFVSGRGDAGTS
jgi:hypothetical protein